RRHRSDEGRRRVPELLPRCAGRRRRHAEALESGKVAAYVTDFANPAVVKMERAIVIPHLGAPTAEAEDNCAKMAVEEVMAYLERGEKIHCVNM
ncbi:hypothetical protein NE591_13800, partial [Adlercreutzia sp. DFI.6.23]|nr:hypothetical protein [Adlercreutzia sp. DFI.6.23]